MDWTGSSLWIGLLSTLTVGTTDFALRPSRWETRSTTPLIENVLSSPLNAPGVIDTLGGRLANVRTSERALREGFDWLEVDSSGVLAVGATAAKLPEELPAEIARPVADLVARLTAAQIELSGAIDSLTPAERSDALAAADAATADEGSPPPESRLFDVASRFDLRRLAAASVAAAAAVDRCIKSFESFHSARPFDVRWESPIGAVLVSSGNAVLDAKELSRAGLILRLGGPTRYLGPAAVAGEKQIRVVIDLGGPVTMISSGPAAGVGEFGIGLFYALGGAHHFVDVGGRSLGTARFGAGLAAFSGEGSSVTSGKFSQGAAAYGVGAFITRGNHVGLRAVMNAQGFGGTRGAGLWRHEGSHLSAECGFVVPDAREPLGSISAGQGAGMGPRAFASGGVGVAYVAGNHANLTASYFSQGSGYWHGLGALFVRGDDATLQSRRYGLGTGVHFGVGGLDVSGRRAKITTWGVGPGFAWDYGVGLFHLRGDDARVRSDWATLRGDLGGRALALVEGDRNELSLNGAGTGSYTRSQPGYGLGIIRGRGVRLRAPGLPATIVLSTPTLMRVDPWGVLALEGDISFDPNLSLSDPVWKAASGRAADVSPKPSATGSVNARRRLSDLLISASAAILDPRPGQAASLALVGLGLSDAPLLAELLNSDRFDELVWARLAASALGPSAAEAAAQEYPHAIGARRAALLDWLKFDRLARSLPIAQVAIHDPDWRIRRQAAFVIGALFDDCGGDEPGRRRFLRDALKPGATPESFGRKRLSDLYAALSLGALPSAAYRGELLAVSGSPFDNVSAEAVRRFLSEISRRPEYKNAFETEERDAQKYLDRARASLREAAEDPDDEVTAAALEALGRLGDPKDAPLLAQSLSASRAARREGAVAGLAHLGAAATTSIRGALNDSRPGVRAAAASAAAQSWSATAFLLVRLALADSDQRVRAAAIAGLAMTPSALRLEQQALVPELSELAESDPVQSVQICAAFARARISPR